MKLFRRNGRSDREPAEPRCDSCGAVVEDEKDALRYFGGQALTAALAFIAWRRLVARRRHVEGLAANVVEATVVDETGQVISGPLAIVPDATEDALSEPETAAGAGGA